MLGTIFAFFGIVLAASLVQGISGFAFNMVVLMFFPYIFSYTESLAMGSLLAVAANFYNVYLYHKKIDWTWIFRWLAVYFVADLVAVFVLKKVGDHPIWYILMAIIFIVMALYLLWGQKFIHVHPSMVTLIIMAFLSGIIMGMFGVGGPLMAAFFLEATQEKEAYLGTSQLVGGCTLGIDFLMRMFNGMFPAALFGYSLFGLIAMAIGLYLAKCLVSKMNALTMRKIICIVIFVDGIIMLINHL